MFYIVSCVEVRFDNCFL